MNTMPAFLNLPQETRLGQGLARNVLSWCQDYGQRGLIVCGHSLERSGQLAGMLDQIADAGTVRIWLHPGGEPTLTQLDALLDFARVERADWVLAAGGGSVMDIAKAAAGLIDAPLSLQTYHDGAPLPKAPIPFIAVPTTAGTGSEATTVSVLTNTETGVKKSIRHGSYLAKLVVLDPDLLAGCPAPVIAASGMDALTQAIEAYCSRGATWLTDSLALKAVELIRDSLESVFGGEPSGREALLTGSYLAGLALANARLGLVHGLAHPLGARFHAAHGLACAVCLPPVLAFNRPAIPEKYEQLCRCVGQDLIRYVDALNQRFGLSSPFAGKTMDDLDAVVQETLASGSTKANPRTPSEQDIVELLTVLFA